MLKENNSRCHSTPQAGLATYVNSYYLFVQVSSSDDASRRYTVPVGIFPTYGSNDDPTTRKFNIFKTMHEAGGFLYFCTVSTLAFIVQ